MFQLWKLQKRRTGKPSNRFKRGYKSPYKNKTYEERYGKERATQIKQKFFRQVIRICPTCKQKFSVNQASPSKYCSKTCFIITHRETMSGKNNPLYGKSPSIETRRKMSLKKQGENHPNWRGGTSYKYSGIYPYPPSWNKDLREQIRKRDFYACRGCGATQTELRYTLHIHHINYDKNNCSPNNLVTLCKSCHSRTNLNRDDWTKTLQEKLRDAL